MQYTQFTEEQVGVMLTTIGAKTIDDLFSPIPAAHRLTRPLDLPKGVSELELLRDCESLAGRNYDCTKLTCFLGCGSYDHFVPTIVDSMAGQSEFLTAYTPYQAEASQGILQLFYEFQTMICALTGMEIANASLYEGATAAAEAVMMAAAITKRDRVLVADNVHPDTLAVHAAYDADRKIATTVIASSGGLVDERSLADALDDGVAAVVIQSPNFFGCVERLDRLIPKIHEHGALAIISTDPLAAGVFKSAGAHGADIVVAEGQPLGIPMQYGGPYLGLLAAREKYLRKMPGRVVGMTTDREGRRAFCLALQTREQHIKRERATSNICTNQGLLAIRAAIHMAALGKRGIAEVSSQCFDKAHYAADAISALDGYSLRFDAPFFKEFVIRTDRDVAAVLDHCRSGGIAAGVALGRFDDRYADCFAVAVTEKRSRTEIDALVSALREA